MKKKAVAAARFCAVSALIWVLFVAGLIVLGGFVKRPPPLLSVSNPFGSMDLTGLPAVEQYRARDGKALCYRIYGAGDRDVAVLIHGSAGSSSDMHALAFALQRTGTTVYVPDLRGHGGNSPHGDVSYIGQLDDDMADFLHFAKPRYPHAKWSLAGFSSGGGFALRIAGSALGRSFDRYILLSPYLRYDAPTERAAAANPDGRQPAPQVWFKAYTARIVGLVILNFIGIHHFDDLPVLAFAVPPNVPSVTDTYSWRMQQSFEPHRDYRADIRSVSEPMAVLVGGSDELHIPDKFAQIFDAERTDIPVTIVPGLDHSDLITKPQGIEAVVAAVRSGSNP